MIHAKLKEFSDFNVAILILIVGYHNGRDRLTWPDDRASDMNTKLFKPQEIIEKLSALPIEKQQIALDFIDSLYKETVNKKVDRKSFLRLPLAERNRILEEQAEAIVQNYQEDDQWREWTDFDWK